MQCSERAQAADRSFARGKVSVVFLRSYRFRQKFEGGQQLEGRGGGGKSGVCPTLLPFRLGCRDKQAQKRVEMTELYSDTVIFLHHCDFVF